MLPSGVSFKREPCMDGGRRAKETHSKARRCEPSRRRCYQSNKGGSRTWLRLEGQDRGVPETESGYLRLDSQRHARHRQQSDRAQIECWSYKKAHPAEMTSFCSREIQSCCGRSREVFDCWIHQRSLLPIVVGQHCHGEEVQQEMVHVRGLHRS